MAIIADIARFQDEMTAWRRHLHAHPELAFQERDTARFVADRLKAFGLDVHEGLARTGVVGTLSCGPGPAIALRADLDGLPIHEESDIPHRSTRPGTMHACGHDGHTTMLLGAARYLAESRRFRGTVHFVFQPAEENEGGAKVMVAEGLFERFPVQSIFGLHNWPGLPEGVIVVRPGPMMAACDSFVITITGHGCHAALPHLGSDCVVAAAAVIVGLQTIVSRTLDANDGAVVSVTQVHAGDAFNVIPETARLAGTVRSFQPAVRDRIETVMARLAEGIAAAHGCRAEVRYDRQYPATVNTEPEAEQAARAAAQVVGAGNVLRDVPPTMGSEDFSFMLQSKPGAYVWLGSGRSKDDPTLHNPRFDFNDRVLAVGASYWAALVESVLA